VSKTVACILHGPDCAKLSGKFIIADRAGHHQQNVVFSVEAPDDGRQAESLALVVDLQSGHASDDAAKRFPREEGLDRGGFYEANPKTWEQSAQYALEDVRLGCARAAGSHEAKMDVDAMSRSDRCRENGPPGAMCGGKNTEEASLNVAWEIILVLWNDEARHGEEVESPKKLQGGALYA